MSVSEFLIIFAVFCIMAVLIGVGIGCANFFFGNDEREKKAYSNNHGNEYADDAKYAENESVQNDTEECDVAEEC